MAEAKKDEEGSMAEIEQPAAQSLLDNQGGEDGLRSMGLTDTQIQTIVSAAAGEPPPSDSSDNAPANDAGAQESSEPSESAPAPVPSDIDPPPPTEAPPPTAEAPPPPAPAPTPDDLFDAETLDQLENPGGVGGLVLGDASAMSDEVREEDVGGVGEEVMKDGASFAEGGVSAELSEDRASLGAGEVGGVGGELQAEMAAAEESAADTSGSVTAALLRDVTPVPDDIDPPPPADPAPAAEDLAPASVAGALQADVDADGPPAEDSVAGELQADTAAQAESGEGVSGVLQDEVDTVTAPLPPDLEDAPIGERPSDSEGIPDRGLAEEAQADADSVDTLGGGISQDLDEDVSREPEAGEPELGAPLDSDGRDFPGGVAEGAREEADDATADATVGVSGAIADDLGGAGSVGDGSPAWTFGLGSPGPTNVVPTDEELGIDQPGLPDASPPEAVPVTGKVLGSPLPGDAVAGAPAPTETPLPPPEEELQDLVGRPTLGLQADIAERRIGEFNARAAAGTADLESQRQDIDERRADIAARSEELAVDQGRMRSRLTQLQDKAGAVDRISAEQLADLNQRTSEYNARVDAILADAEAKRAAAIAAQGTPEYENLRLQANGAIGQVPRQLQLLEEERFLIGIDAARFSREFGPDGAQTTSLNDSIASWQSGNEAMNARADAINADVELVTADVARFNADQGTLDSELETQRADLQERIDGINRDIALQEGQRRAAERVAEVALERELQAQEAAAAATERAFEAAPVDIDDIPTTAESAQIRSNTRLKVDNAVRSDGSLLQAISRGTVTGAEAVQAGYGQEDIEAVRVFLDTTTEIRPGEFVSNDSIADLTPGQLTELKRVGADAFQRNEAESAGIELEALTEQPIVPTVALSDGTPVRGDAFNALPEETQALFRDGGMAAVNEHNQIGAIEDPGEKLAALQKFGYAPASAILAGTDDQGNPTYMMPPTGEELAQEGREIVGPGDPGTIRLEMADGSVWAVSRDTGEVMGFEGVFGAPRATLTQMLQDNGRFLGGFVPILGTALNWNEMSGGQRAFSIGLDALIMAPIALAAAGSVRTIVAPTVRSAVIATERRLAGEFAEVIPALQRPFQAVSTAQTRFMKVLQQTQTVERQIKRLQAEIPGPRTGPIIQRQLARAEAELTGLRQEAQVAEQALLSSGREYAGAARQFGARVDSFASGSEIVDTSRYFAGLPDALVRNARAAFNGITKKPRTLKAIDGDLARARVAVADAKAPEQALRTVQRVTELKGERLNALNVGAKRFQANLAELDSQIQGATGSRLAKLKKLKSKESANLRGAINEMEAEWGRPLIPPPEGPTPAPAGGGVGGGGGVATATRTRPGATYTAPKAPAGGTQGLPGTSPVKPAAGSTPDQVTTPGSVDSADQSGLVASIADKNQALEKATGAPLPANAPAPIAARGPEQIASPAPTVTPVEVPGSAPVPAPLSGSTLVAPADTPTAPGPFTEPEVEPALAPEVEVSPEVAPSTTPRTPLPSPEPLVSPAAPEDDPGVTPLTAPQVVPAPGPTPGIDPGESTDPNVVSSPDTFPGTAPSPSISPADAPAPDQGPLPAGGAGTQIGTGTRTTLGPLTGLEPRGQAGPATGPAGAPRTAGEVETKTGTPSPARVGVPPRGIRGTGFFIDNDFDDTKQELAAGLFPRVLRFRMGFIEQTIDLQTGDRTFRRRTKPGPGKPELSIVSTDRNAPPSRELRQGIVRITVSPQGIVFKPVPLPRPEGYGVPRETAVRAKPLRRSRGI